MSKAGSAHSTNRAITVGDLIVSDGEPRVEDLRLAGALGFAQAHMIRPLIKRHLASLARFGEVSFTCKKPGVPISDEERKKRSKGGRPGTTYFLNRKQALFIAAKSDTERAAEIAVEMVEVFDAHLAARTAKPVSVEGHQRALPKRKRSPSAQTAASPTVERDGFAVMRIGGEVLVVDLRHAEAGPGRRAVVIGWDDGMAVQDMTEATSHRRFLGARSFNLPDAAAKGGKRSVWAVGTVVAAQTLLVRQKVATPKTRAAKAPPHKAAPLAVPPRPDLAGIEVCGTA